ncbi:MAG: replicative DNA helicase [Eubacteriales bacterium]|nr:replicative DNA helicase [Eubacteriales bacterium]MDD4390834.1 replicative DNA helicase [Eubacteriales bacterium]
MAITERIPPHNNDAERSVLGAAMLSKDALFDVIQEVRPADFYDSKHKEIFRAISDLCRRNSPVDTLTVSEELKKSNTLELSGGRAYIAELSADVPSTANASSYAKIVVEKAMLRKLIGAAGEITQESYTEKMEPEDILDFAERKVFEIAQSRQAKDIIPLKQVLLENIELIDKAGSMEGDITGISTGFRDLDSKTSGLQRSDLIILAARPAMGKTAFALNIAQNAALKSNANVLIFSMEMPKEQLGQRLLSMESRIDIQKLKTGQLNRSDWDDLNIALDTLSRANIFIDDTPGISIMEIKNKCRRVKAEHGLDLVILDYLQLMSYDGKADSRQQEISTLSRFLKLLAREIDCPVMVLSQLSRAPEMRSNHEPMLSDLRESGAIEQDADIVLFLYRDDYYTKEESQKPGVCDVIIAKHRSGPIGTVELTWLDKYTRFVDKSGFQE